jgi:hypothetical protein
MTEQGTKQARNFEGYSDHDLLIRILTLQEVQTADIQGLRSDCSRLWAEKAAQNDLILLRATVEHLRSQKADVTATADQERRLRNVERWQFVSTGGLIMLQFGLLLLVKYLWH